MITEDRIVKIALKHGLNRCDENERNALFPFVREVLAEVAGARVERPNTEAGRLPGCVKPDTDAQVFFYEQDYYVLSNFSAFTLEWHNLRFDTSEAAYHWEKFPANPEIQSRIVKAKSAHDAFKEAERCKELRRPDWDEVKVGIMLNILRAKAGQHEYVRRKLLATGVRELVEDSWRDEFWGWGSQRDGKNMLGRLWMQVRDELSGMQGAGGSVASD